MLATRPKQPHHLVRRSGIGTPCTLPGKREPRDVAAGFRICAAVPRKEYSPVIEKVPAGDAIDPGANEITPLSKSSNGGMLFTLRGRRSKRGFDERRVFIRQKGVIYNVPPPQDRKKCLGSCWIACAMRAISTELLKKRQGSLKFLLNDSAIAFFPASQQHRDVKLEGLSYEDDYRGNALRFG